VIESVKRGVELFPSRIFAPIILGTITGVGGLLLKPFLLNLYLGIQYERSVLTNPGLELYVPLLLSAFYFLTKFLWNTQAHVIEIFPKFSVVITPEIVVKGVFVLFFLWVWFTVRVVGIGSSATKKTTVVTTKAPPKPAPAIEPVKTKTVGKAKKN
jgi:hypothetical protein